MTTSERKSSSNYLTFDREHGDDDDACASYDGRVAAGRALYSWQEKPWRTTRPTHELLRHDYVKAEDAYRQGLSTRCRVFAFLRRLSTGSVAAADPACPIIVVSCISFGNGDLSSQGPISASWCVYDWRSNLNSQSWQMKRLWCDLCDRIPAITCPWNSIVDMIHDLSSDPSFFSLFFPFFSMLNKNSNIQDS